MPGMALFFFRNFKKIFYEYGGDNESEGDIHAQVFMNPADKQAGDNT